jgi:large subunit ribosomal protein L1
MDKNKLLEAIKQIKAESKKRNFKESIDLIVNLKQLDLKKPEHQVDFFTTLPFNRGKDNRICALAGPESKDEAKTACDFTVSSDEFEAYKKDIKKVKKLADSYDFFLAQANIMPLVAGTFGRVLGTRQKMPNPKSGAIFPPKANLKPLVEKMKKTVRVAAKKDPHIMLAIGTTDQKSEEIAENIITLYNQIVHHLPGELNNVRNVMIKQTMGKPVPLEK